MTQTNCNPLWKNICNKSTKKGRYAVYPPFCFAFLPFGNGVVQRQTCNTVSVGFKRQCQTFNVQNFARSLQQYKDCSYVGKSVVKIPATRITFACAVVVVVRLFRAATQSTSVVIANWQANSDEISTVRVMLPTLYPTTSFCPLKFVRLRRF